MSVAGRPLLDLAARLELRTAIDQRRRQQLVKVGVLDGNGRINRGRRWAYD